MAKAEPTIVEVGGVSFAKGTATIAVAVPSHLRNKVGPSDGMRFGKRTGLRMTHFADALLIANEKAHATDEVLAATLAAEFPKRATAESGVKGVPTIQKPAAYRAYFNAQKHGHNELGSHSRSYNAEGEPRSDRQPAKAKAKAKGKASKAKGKLTAKATNNGKGKGSKPKAKSPARQASDALASA